MRITLKKIEQGTCPYCGGTDIDYDVAEFEDDYIFYRATCSECKRSFEEWYKLEFVGHNVGDDFEVALDAGEEGVDIEVED